MRKDDWVSTNRWTCVDDRAVKCMLDACCFLKCPRGADAAQAAEGRGQIGMVIVKFQDAKETRL
jgi:hypothetical protein